MAVLSSDWPAELLEVLFDFIASDKSLKQSGLLTSCLCVSARWRDIGLQRLWTHISLTPTQLHAFLSVPATSNYVLVKSLTLLIVPVRPAVKPGCEKWMDGELRAEFYVEDPVEMGVYGNSGTRALWKSLAKLPDLLPMMVALQTFSFYVTHNDFTPADVGFWIRYSDVKRILASLPAAVENLELDTKGLETYHTAEQHLCLRLAKRIPQLHSLRLRLGRMCQQVLAGESATFCIREIVINLLFPEFKHGTRECTAGECVLGDRVAGSLRRALVDKMLAIEGASQRARAMLVLDSINPGDDKWLRDTINRYDVLAKEILSEPVTGGLAESKYEIRHFNESSKLDEDILGKCADLEELIEGNTWIQTTQGVRLPRSCLPRRWRVAVEQPIFELNGIRTAIGKMGLGQCGMWRYEDEAGRPLLATRRTPGLGEVEALRREEVDGERLDGEGEDYEEEWENEEFVSGY